MLNPDGVINGSHRCNLSGTDLNRQWIRPSASLHPTIYHTKALIQYMVRCYHQLSVTIFKVDVLNKRPLTVVDFHGHSRRFNVFMFGNNPNESWQSTDREMVHHSEFAQLPQILDQVSNHHNYYTLIPDGTCIFIIKLSLFNNTIKRSIGSCCSLASI